MDVRGAGNLIQGHTFCVTFHNAEYEKVGP